MQAHRILLSLAVLSPLAACAEVADEQTPLLFGLTEVDVQQIHDTYHPAESISIMRAQLAAPFDCAAYGELCEELGPDAALAMTEQQVELALAGTPRDEIERVYQTIAKDARQAPPMRDGVRTAGPWAYDTDPTGTFRLAVRNGVSTPVIGNRHAYTEAHMQHASGSSWPDFAANQLCVDAGTNTQTSSIHTSSGTVDTVIESVNPGPACAEDEKTLKIWTLHDRNNGTEGPGFQTWFTVTARGSAWATVASESFGRTIASPHSNLYY